MLEFLDRKDEYSETDLEEALIQRLTDFLLEQIQRPHSDPVQHPSVGARSYNPAMSTMDVSDGKQGSPRHWILEIHFVDRELQIGGFFEELLTVSGDAAVLQPV